MHVYMYTCKCVLHVYVRMCMCTCVCACVRVFVDKYVCKEKCVCERPDVYVPCICVCIEGSMYVRELMYAPLSLTVTPDPVRH